MIVNISPKEFVIVDSTLSDHRLIVQIDEFGGLISERMPKKDAKTIR